MSRQAKGNLIALAGIIILLILTVIAARSAGIAYNGLVYGDMPIRLTPTYTCASIQSR